MIRPGPSNGRNVDLNKATRHGGVDSVNNALNVRAELRPLLTAKNDDDDFPAHKVLLIAQILIRGQQNIEPGSFGGR